MNVNPTGPEDFGPSPAPDRPAAPDALPAMGVTEARNPATADIDTLSTLQMVRLINDEDARVAPAVAAEAPAIAAAIDAIAARLAGGGRLIYAGAGTSGRLGVLDASECPPTFSAPPGLVVGLIAGGERALTHSIEGAEDDPAAGERDLVALDVSPLDAVVGIAASGRTPYVLGALQAARRRGALTVSLACNHPSPMAALAAISIAPLVGPEVIAGSTRLKAGTAQKMVLNLLSTGVMIRLGKTFGNLMVDVQASNSKLRVRARRIVAEACGLSPEDAAALLEGCGGEVKTAIVSGLAGIAPDEARRRLAAAGGVVRRALAGALSPEGAPGDEAPAVKPSPTGPTSPPGPTRSTGSEARATPLLLGIDGGGTKTTALLATAGGQVLGRGSGPACNYQSVGAEAAWSALDDAVRAAFDDAGQEPGPVAAACLGLAGAARAEDRALFAAWIADRLPGARGLVVNDAELVLAAGTPEGWGVALICGTGSIAYGRSPDGRSARAGGWGYLLGDEGSGYHMGLSALRAVARAADGRGPTTALTAAILAHWDLPSPEALIRRVYQEPLSRAEVAGLAALVEDAALAGDAVGAAIIAHAGEELARAVDTVARALALSGPLPCAQAGGLLIHGRAVGRAVSAAAEALGLALAPVRPVPEPAVGALRLAQGLLPAQLRG